MSIEQLANNPWRLLVATILLNKTTGKAAIPVFWELMSLWPTAMEMALGITTNVYYVLNDLFFLSGSFKIKAPHGKMVKLLSPLGFGTARALWLTKFSLAYELKPPVSGVVHRSRAKDFVAGDYPSTEISHLPNMGKYALDSYRIFCCKDEWMNKWKWAFLYQLEWNAEDGVVGKLSQERFSDLCEGRW
ncbi:hypothetical protein Clacol_002296 [Clathrus columnatus]|uniref:Uncharacterized protein n=1 Tax=Clathrus columnatus TaxID=1419009 RepID=A0AAV5A3N7_9AGAM|nr:hypothetical protein Clacol_002296 [Clathrus columnatus]